MKIRDARPEDAEALLGVYRPYVLESPASFELELPPVEEFRARIAAAQATWAWLVAERDGVPVGYAYGTPFRARPAYHWSVETSAYVDARFHRQGIGESLYRELLAAVTERGACNAYAGITMPNDGSVALHRSLGFVPVGVFRRAGWKFSRWHDVSWWQRELRERPPGA